MGCDIIPGVIDLGASWVSFEDFESGKYDSTRRRCNGGKNTIAAVGDVCRRPGDRFVDLEVLQCYNCTACLDRRLGRPLSTMCTRIERSLLEMMFSVSRR